MKRLLFTVIALLSVSLAIAQLPCNLSFQTGASTTNPLNITVTNTSTFAVIGNNTPSCYLTWGDNTSSGIYYQTGSTASHTYAAAGTYTITLYCYYYDSINSVVICNTSTAQTITVNALPCAASISTVNNGSGSYTFTANPLGTPTTTPTYTWNFGDGSATVTGTPVTHTYANSGTYTVTLISVSGGCQYSTTTTVQYYNGTVNCASLSANFSYNISTNNLVYFTNTSSNVNIAGVTRNSSWSFGDGGTSTLTSPSHAYALGGTYTVSLSVQWYDSMTNTVLCTKNTTQTITVTTTTPPNFIKGYVMWDSLNSTPILQASFKVWLIQYDSATTTLTAVDSSIVGGYMSALYTFSNKPAGIYRTKAAPLNGTLAASSYVPTYHDTTLYWNTANLIYHNGGSTQYKNIHMKHGTWAGGPGFIGGNVSLGANKGTNNGVANLLIMLRDASNQLVRFTYTDVNGDFSFGNLAAGTYNVYPESMNYTTTPSSALTLSTGQYNVSGVNFKQTPGMEIKPITTDITGIEGKMFSIYPNPSTGNINITWGSSITGKATVTVTDMTGRQVYNLTNDASQISNISLGQIQSGIYFIRINTGKGDFSEKIMIQ
jgi:PKD repeat protein